MVKTSTRSQVKQLSHVAAYQLREEPQPLPHQNVLLQQLGGMIIPHHLHIRRQYSFQYDRASIVLTIITLLHALFTAQYDFILKVVLGRLFLKPQISFSYAISYFITYMIHSTLCDYNLYFVDIGTCDISRQGLHYFVFASNLVFMFFVK